MHRASLGKHQTSIQCDGFIQFRGTNLQTLFVPYLYKPGSGLSMTHILKVSLSLKVANTGCVDEDIYSGLLIMQRTLLLYFIHFEKSVTTGIFH